MREALSIAHPALGPAVGSPSYLPFVERLPGHVEVLAGQGDLDGAAAEVGLLQCVLSATVDKQRPWRSEHELTAGYPVKNIVVPS